MRRMSHLAVFISILAVAIRLILIDQPFVDHWSWRQSDVAAIARNYFQGGYNFARPQIDWAGDQPGYVGTEFPILPFIAALLYKLFGPHEWIGRIQAVILFALSLPFFFLITRKIFGEIAAVCALACFSFVPLGIMTSRCFMPDMPSLALSIVGLYFFQRWIEPESAGQARSASAFFVSALCISLSILIKATSIVIAAPLVCLAFQTFRKPPLRLGAAFQRFKLWFFAAIVLVPSAIWYWHAYQISLQFYPHHFFGAGGVRLMSGGWYANISKQIVTSELTPVVAVIGVVGIVAERTNLRARLLYWWLAAMILFVIAVGYGNRHPWYRLPLVPIFAAFAGAACARVLSARAFSDARSFAALLMRAGFAVVVVAFAALALGYTQELFTATAAPLRDGGLKIKAVAPANALLVAADNGDPTIFYYAERKGWHFLEKNGIFDGEPRDSAQAIVDLESVRKRGGSFLVFTSNTSWWLDYYQELGQYVASNSTLVEATPGFKIYRFKPTSQ